jgi:hypothetical protein
MDTPKRIGIATDKRSSASRPRFIKAKVMQSARTMPYVYAQQAACMEETKTGKCGSQYLLEPRHSSFPPRQVHRIC